MRLHFFRAKRLASFVGATPVLSAATMLSLPAQITSEATNLRSKTHDAKRMIDETYNILHDKADNVAENRGAFGEPASKQLFASIETNLTKLMRASAKHAAVEKALQQIGGTIADDASPRDVQKAFTEAVAAAEKQEATALETSSEPLKKLRKIVKDSDKSAGAGSSGAGPSGANDEDDDLGEDGFAMTQATRTTKCPISMVEMTSSGDTRPVKGPCGHCFAFNAIKDSLRRSGNVCPQAGCNKSLTMGQLVDDKELIKEIKKKERARA